MAQKMPCSSAGPVLQTLQMKTKRFNIYMLSCFIVVFVKIWLISKNEIVSIPADAEAYVSRAVNGLWEIGLMHSGYPIWLYITQQLGFPQRISIEILYLASCFFVSTTVKAYVNYVAATLLFFVLAFAPFTYFLFDQALSDGFYLCLTLVASGFSLKLLNCRQLKIGALAIYASGLGVTLGVMLITRAEDQLIFFWIFTVLALFLAFCRVQHAKLFCFNFWRMPFYLLFITSLATFLVVTTVCTIFYVRSGVFARSITLLSGHYLLLEKLSMIDSRIPQNRYIPISSASRILAYGVSPTLNRLRDEVEDTNNILQDASRKAGLPKGEIGAGWIWWAFLGAMYKTIPDPSPVILEDLFMEINDELDAAFTDGRLQKRFIINSLIGGNILKLFSDLPSGVLTVLGKVFSSHPYSSDQLNNSDIFNKVCLRRGALIGRPNHIVLQGWAFAALPQKNISFVLARTVDGSYGKATYIKRVDVSNGFAKSNGWKPEVYGFRVEIEGNLLENVTLVYFLDDGTTVDSNSFLEGQVLTVVNRDDNNSKVVQGIDIAKLDTFNARSGKRHEMQGILIRYMSSNTAVLLASTILIIFFILALIKVIKKKYDTDRNIFVLQLFLFLIFGARILFYSLIETASWHVETRYLASAQALFFIFISISIATIITASRDFKFFKTL
jgi:hypothetical protein